MFDKKIHDLAIQAAKKTPMPNYSLETINDAFRGEIGKLVYDYNSFMKHRYDIYEIIIEAADEIVPNKVISAMKPFAEVKTVKQGQKAMFKVSKGKTRAKKFLTQVGLSGVYESFRLDNTTYELNTWAIGGAVTVDWERMLDGADTMADLMDIITEGLEDAIFIEVQKALRASLNYVNRPDNNKVDTNTFDPAEMVKLINTVKAYAPQAIIFAPPEFVSAMGPDAIVPIPDSGNYGGVYSPEDIEEIHRTGYITLFRGTPIVQIPQSFVDENNVKTWIDPTLAYVLPAGKEKVVKVVLEGNTQITDFQNPDHSMEIHTWKKLGVGIESYHNWGIYRNSGIPQTVDTDIYDF
jgi:hypothetical protein